MVVKGTENVASSMAVQLTEKKKTREEGEGESEETGWKEKVRRRKGKEVCE